MEELKPGTPVETSVEPIYLERIASALEAGGVTDKEGLHQLKQRLAREFKARVPRDSELIAALPADVVDRHLAVLRKKPMRTGSGVAILAVMSSPAGCPHGKCVYCPGGPEVDSPQSYTGFEPSTMRAKRWNYDSFSIARSRLGQLAGNGHSVAKVDVVIQGGTFPARDLAYQDWFVAGIYAGCNAGPDPEPEAGFVPLELWQLWSEETREATLQSVMKENETADCRIIGLTIETKPDWCLEPHVDGMLRYGCTRVELGIQTLDEETTQLTHRGHTVQDAADSLRVCRDAGLKVCVHMMPGLPRRSASRESPLPIRTEGSDRMAEPEVKTAKADLMPSPEMDLEDMRRLFAESDWRPDMLKIYPTLVVQEGETPLKKWWKEGRYAPYTTEQAADVIAASYAFIPAYCRIQRVDRDIPTTHVEAGVQNSNLRQIVEAKATRDGVAIRDVRAREVHRLGGTAADLVLVAREYEASGGTEVFLSFEDPATDGLAGFLRLRLAGPSPHRSEMQHPDGVAIVRELKVYGTAQDLGQHGDGAFQHLGLGGRLMDAAEEQAKAWGVGRILVIAGVGVKPYYRRRGYQDLGPYVAKSP